jgi:hypothetical protein
MFLGKGKNYIQHFCCELHMKTREGKFLDNINIRRLCCELYMKIREGWLLHKIKYYI